MTTMTDDTWVEEEYNVVTVQLGGQDFDLRVKRPGPKESMAVVSKLTSCDLYDRIQETDGRLVSNVADMSQQEMDAMVEIAAEHTLGIRKSEVEELPLSTVVELFTEVIRLTNDELEAVPA